MKVKISINQSDKNFFLSLLCLNKMMILLRKSEFPAERTGYERLYFNPFWIFKEKLAKVNKFLVLKCCKKDIPLIWDDNINPKRHLDKLKLHFNN